LINQPRLQQRLGKLQLPHDALARDAVLNERQFCCGQGKDKAFGGFGYLGIFFLITNSSRSAKQ
jgi:hypothetical protein